MDFLKNVLSLFLVTAICSINVNAQDVSAEKLQALTPISSSAAKPVVAKKYQLLYFWASWCPDCRGKIQGKIQKLETDFPQLSLKLVSLDRSLEKATDFTREQKTTGEIFYDDEKKLAQSLSVFSVPSWTLLKQKNQNWEVVVTQSGSDLDEIKNKINQLEEKK